MNKSCAVLGQSPMRFRWGFDEEDEGCKKLKLVLLEQILVLRHIGVTRFMVACDCGVGLYAAEIINILRESDSELELNCLIQYEEQATKWAPYLRNRYFKMLEKCAEPILFRKVKAPGIQLDAFKHMIDCSDMVLAVYDPASFREDDVDSALQYANEHNKPITGVQ